MKNKKIIVAIGGGDVKPIDREIIRLTGKQHPKALFIPTASSDEFMYIAWFEKRYGQELGCQTDVLCLLADQPNLSAIRSLIEEADIIYVGGGNTLKMMRLWRKLGVNKMLKKAYLRGVVMCGVSAGAICWFDYGHSDSMAYYNPKKWDYIRVKGLEFIKTLFCPHFDSATEGIKRNKSYRDMIKKFGGSGIAADNNAAFCFIDDQFKILSVKGGGAYKITKNRGKLITEEIKAQPTFLSIKMLMD